MGFIYMLTGPKHAPKRYIGQTKRTSNRRFIEHACMKGCPLIHAAIQEHGKESFTTECLIEINDELLDEYEQRMTAAYDTVAPHGYNLSTGGKAGCKWVQDVIDSRKVFGENHHWHHDNGWTGKQHTPETRANMSVTMKAVYTEERRKRQSELSKSRKTHDLPDYISVKRFNGKITGYQVQMQDKGIPFKSFAKQSNSLEENLRLAVQYRDEQLAKLPSSSNV